VQLRPGAFVALTVPDRIWRSTFRLPETADAVNSDHVFRGCRMASIGSAVMFS
jgi:hypothetical protein